MCKMTHVGYVEMDRNESGGNLVGRIQVTYR